MDDDAANIVQFRGPPLRPEKSNPSVPDHVWEEFQKLGEVAAKHLRDLLTDERFPNLTVKEQMRIIETTFARAYGSVDGSVRRNLHMHVNPEDNAGFNALTSLSRRASRQLPEFRRRVTDSKSTDADTVEPITSHDPIDGQASEAVTSDRDKV